MERYVDIENLYKTSPVSFLASSFVQTAVSIEPSFCVMTGLLPDAVMVALSAVSGIIESNAKTIREMANS